jgi:hypothetical protein
METRMETYHPSMIRLMALGSRPGTARFDGIIMNYPSTWSIPLEKTHGYMTSANFGEMYNFHGERKDYQINYQMVRKKKSEWVDVHLAALTLIF